VYSSKHFWLVCSITGLFSGLWLLVLYFGLSLLTNNYYSIYYILIYLFPLFTAYLASIILRNRFGKGVMRFAQSFKLTIFTLIISAVFFSVGIYFIYIYLNQPAFDMRTSLIESEIMLKENGMTMDEMKEKKDVIHQILSPMSIAVMYFILNIVLTPFFALIIAIFAKRKSRFINY
jgi:hypothetical protein